MLLFFARRVIGKTNEAGKGDEKSPVPTREENVMYNMK